jgi:hypothetical protein
VHHHHSISNIEENQSNSK